MRRDLSRAIVVVALGGFIATSGCGGESTESAVASGALAPSLTVDFGAVPVPRSGEQIQGSIGWKNPLGRLLVIGSISRSCACATASLEPMRLAAHEVAELRYQITTAGRSGEFRTSLRLLDVEGQWVQEVVLKGVLIRPAAAIPSSVLLHAAADARVEATLSLRHPAGTSAEAVVSDSATKVLKQSTRSEGANNVTDVRISSRAPASESPRSWRYRWKVTGGGAPSEIEVPVTIVSTSPVRIVPSRLVVTIGSEAIVELQAEDPSGENAMDFSKAVVGRSPAGVHARMLSLTPTSARLAIAVDRTDLQARATVLHVSLGTYDVRVPVFVVPE